MNVENTNNGVSQESTTTNNLPAVVDVAPPPQPKRRLHGLGACLMAVILVMCVVWLVQRGDGVVREVTRLDPWFGGLSVNSYTCMTTNELGGSSTSPLGMFCRDYCCVLKDGTVVTRSNSMDGSRVALVVSDYAVPEEWYGKAVLLDRYNPLVVLVVDCLSIDEYAYYRGDVWVWNDVSQTYFYHGTGSASPCDEPAKTTTDVASL